MSACRRLLASHSPLHRELTRTRLFEALGSLMAEQSFESITMSQIAERAGVGRTAVYNHFADKEVLLLAYMRQVTEEFTAVLTQRLAAEPDPLMRLRLYIRSPPADDEPLPRQGWYGVASPDVGPRRLPPA